MTRDDLEKIEWLKKYLAIEFEIKNLGKLKYILGKEVAHSKSGIFILRQKYVFDLLWKIGMLAFKLIDTTIEQNHKLRDAKKEAIVDQGMYQRLVGKNDLLIPY